MQSPVHSPSSSSALHAQARNYQDHQLYVLKAIAFDGASQADAEAALREANVLALLRHPHIVPYKVGGWAMHADPWQPQHTKTADRLSACMHACMRTPSGVLQARRRPLPRHGAVRGRRSHADHQDDPVRRGRGRPHMHACSASTLGSDQEDCAAKDGTEHGSHSCLGARNSRAAPSPSPCRHSPCCSPLRSKSGSCIDEDLVWQWLVELLLALSYCHSKKILHR
jgi:hypothetical protein